MRIVVRRSDIEQSINRNVHTHTHNRIRVGCNIAHKPTVTDVRVKIHNENRNITIELYSLATNVRNMAQNLETPFNDRK